MSRVRIGSAVDHQMSHYGFVRNSKLPHGTFDDPVDWFVVCTWITAIVGAVGLAAAIWFGW